jgi:polysaccharide transporter, PST family
LSWGLGNRRDPAETASSADPASEQPSHGRLPSGPVKWAYVMNWGQQGVTLLVSIVLAAILGPRTYGIVALAIIYIAFVQLVLDQGISQTIVQRAELDDEHLDAAFWMNLVWAALLVGATIAISPWWARANGTHELEPVMDVLSIALLIQALTVVQQAVLRREMKFKRLALRSNVAALAGGVVAVVLAVEGAGIWSLVAQRLVTAGVALVLLWVVGRWVPKFRFSRPHARSLLGFSVQTFAGNLAVFVNRRVDALLIGLFFGPAAVGLYRLADRLIESLLQVGTYPVQLFALSHFARLQHEPTALRRAVHGCMRLTMLVTVPLMLIVFASSKYVVGVLGPQWKPAGDALKLFAIVGIGKTAVAFTAALLIAVSKPHWRALMEWTFAAMSAAAFAVAALMLRGGHTSDQVFGMATSRVVLFVGIFVPINILIVTRTTGLSLSKILGSLKAPLAAGVAAVAAVLVAEHIGVLSALGGSSRGDRLERFVVAGAVACIAAGLTLLAADRNRRAQVTALVRRRRTWAESPPEAGAIVSDA